MQQITDKPQDAGARLACFILAIVLLLGFTPPADATPNRAASSADQLLAANATHFYVLRDLVDNRGTYYGEFRDQYLVEIRFDDHKATRFWLLRRLTLSFEDYTDPFTNWQEADIAQVDLMAVLKENNAIPIRALNQSDQMDLFHLNDTGLEPEAVKAAPISTGEIGVLARRQLNPLARTYGPDPESENWMGSQIAVEPVGFNPRPDCKITDAIAPFLRAGQHFAGVKLECYFEPDVYDAAQFYLFVPLEEY